MKYKLLFHICALLLIATEAYRAYLLVPMPGSQEAMAVDTSYFLYHYRWIVRIVLFTGMLIGYRKVFEKRPWLPMLTLFVAGFVFYVANFVMTAEAFFQQPETIAFASPADGKVPMDAVVIGVTIEGESKAYPIRYLSFHHHIMDTVGGKAILVTYCDVCRSGIVFSPVTNGEPTTFRLVGMDRFNAMIEDRNTGSWFMQANGECIAGELKGQSLPVVNSEQLSLANWASRYPAGKVMLPDPEFIAEYDDGSFEKGTSTFELTKTDTASWQDKSWVIGVEYKGNYRAYDWNELLRKRIIHDELGGDNIVVTIDSSNVNFRVYRFNKPDHNRSYFASDTLVIGMRPREVMEVVPARQMFWHTWRTFYPATTRYGAE